MTEQPASAPPLFIHVGLHKTGTTFLQHEVFPKLKSLQLLEGGETANWLRRLATEEDSSFDPAVYQEYFYPLVEAGPTLISHEGLSGATYLRYVNQTRTADRLLRLFPHANIILSIRRQDTFLVSLYLNFIEGGGSASLAKFLGYENGKFINEYWAYGHQVNLPMFRFDYIAQLYADRFDGGICILPFERMTNDIADYMQCLCQYVGEAEVPAVRNIVHNKSYGKYQLLLARALNRFFLSPMNPDGIIPEFGLPGLKVYSLKSVLGNNWTHRLLNSKPRNKVVMPEKLARAVMEYYSPSNAALEEKWRLGLRRWGYILDDSASLQSS